MPRSRAAHRGAFSRTASARPTSRRGVALLMVLGMLALATAMLAGGAAWSASAARAMRAERASALATAVARRVAAEQLARWSAADDALAVGAVVERDVSFIASSGQPVEARVRLQRLTTRLFVIAAEVRRPASGGAFAQRRMRLVVERPVIVEGAPSPVPRALERWAFNELH